MAIRYISDLHFSHANIIGYDNRPFSSVDEMDNAMISLWNETVSAKDEVYVLGDFCWSQTYEDWEKIISQLNGKIFIIKGNHDRSNILKRLEKKGFITGWSHQEIISDGENKVVLNHSPMPFFVNEFKDNWAHLYGHVHVSFDWNMTLNIQRQINELYLKPIRMYNVGCMMPYIDYVPRTLAEIEEGFKQADLLNFDFSKRHQLPSH